MSGFNKGATCPANYQKTGVPDFDGNPLIEALPPNYTEEDIVEHLSYAPDLPAKIRRLPSHTRRCVLASQIRTLFQPLSLHFDLERRLAQSLRTGYLLRNPCSKRRQSSTGGNSQLFTPGLRTSPSLQTAPLGLSLIGMSGMGKTTSLVGILQGLYPQVIVHSRYNGQPLILQQVPWLIVSCPSDGASLKELCNNFFSEMDALLGTKYEEQYKGETAEQLGRAMATVASVQALGLLVIDEIQFLNAARSGGHERLLNFFVELVNTIGIPVVMVGTYHAMKVLGKYMMQVRRAGGTEGEIIWDNWLEDSSDYQLLCEALFQHQYVKKPVALSSEMRSTLYDVTQGVTDYIVKVFTAAQVRAIDAGKEQITSGIIRSVAKDLLRQAEPFLDALRRKDRGRLMEMEDVAPIDLDQFLSRETRRMKVVRPDDGDAKPKPAAKTKHSARGSCEKRSARAKKKGNQRKGKKAA